MKNVPVQLDFIDYLMDEVEKKDHEFTKQQREEYSNAIDQLYVVRTPAHKRGRRVSVREHYRHI